MIQKISHIILFVFFTLTIYAQLEVVPIKEEIIQLSDFYNLEISNPSGSPYIVFIEVEVRQDNQLVYQSRTNQYSIISPISLLNEAQLQPIQITRNDISNLSGDYQVDVRIIDQTSQQVLFVDRFQLSAGSVSLTAKKERTGIGFEYSGQANLYGQISSMQGIGSQVPQNYMRAEIHPDFQVGGIPIGLDILLSTEQNAFRQSMNQVALRFDAQQFKRTMQKRLQSKVKEIEAIGDITDVQNLNQLKEKATAKKYPKLKEWETQLADPIVKEGLGQSKQLASIEQVLESPEVKEALTKKATLDLKKQLTPEESEELKRLQSFATEIEKLNTKADQVRAGAKKYEQFKDLNSKINEAKKYTNKDVIKDPAFLKEGMKSLNLMSKPQEILSGFDAITIGTSYPYYSRLSLSSLSVNGINIEWNPGKIYLAATYGLSTRMTFNKDFANPVLTLPQTTLATKFGYGSPQSTHLHLTYMNVSDKFDNLSLDNSTKPQTNKIIGTDAQISLFSDRITVGGELNASLLTRDNTINTDDVQEFKREDIPLNSLLGDINNSSSFDLAWRAFTDVKVFGNATKIKGSIERIGANYFSLGAPTLLNDLLRWKAEVRQTFLNNKVSISAFARQDANNLNPILTSARSTTKSYGISGSANFPKLPSITFSFAPYSQNSEIISTNENFNTNATMLNLGVGYPIQFTQDISTYTQLTFLSQDLNSNISDIDYNLKMYGVNQSITYKRNSLNISANYTPNQVINQTNQKVITLNASASTQLFDKLTTSLGLQYLSITDQESRTGYFVNANYPVTSFTDFEVRIQRNVYATQDEIDNFNDIIGWGGLKIRW